MSIRGIIRSIAAAIWGPGGSVVAPPPHVAYREARMARNRALGLPDEFLLVRRDGDRTAGKTDRGVGVSDEAGQPSVIDHDMPACSRVGAFQGVFRDEPRRLGLEGNKRSPWNPWEGGL